jgi:hypothetical protein
MELSTIYRRNKPFRRETGPKPKFSGSGLVAHTRAESRGSRPSKADAREMDSNFRYREAEPAERHHHQHRQHGCARPGMAG